MMLNMFFIFLFVLFTTQAYSSSHHASQHTMDEKRLKEIADIRRELNEAFEKDIDMKSSIEKGVIVQPGWTEDSNKKSTPTKVKVTSKNLKEAALIRDEIQRAIENNYYVKGGELSNTDNFYEMRFRSKNLLANLIGTKSSDLSYEEVGSDIEEELEEGMPNVVESHAFQDIEFDTLKRLKTSSRRTREVLVLQEIIEDLSFDLGEDVKEWKHFEHDSKEYFIGLRESDLLVVEKNQMKYANRQIIAVNAPISVLECFCFWNKNTWRQEGMVLVAVGEEVLWYQANDNEVFWKWSTGMPITGLTYFKIDQNEYLAIVSNTSARTEFSALNIYQFDIRQKEFWIVQKLQLEHSTSEIIFFDTGRDVVLAVVQGNSAAIFTFNPRLDQNSNYLKFELKSTIDSEGIQSVSGFQMGGLSYLALGGLTPQILQYSKGEFLPKTIFGQNFGLVELFLPIPSRTYRDDLVLLVQHRVTFDSHDLVVLEALIWNGEVFEATTTAPCVIGNYTFGFGVGCMLDIHRENGIKGSTVLKRGNDVFVIVPRHNAESGLFQLKTELLSKNSELLDLGEIFTFLQEWVQEQENLIQEAYNFLHDTNDHLTEPNSKTVNLASLKTPELDFNGPVGEIFINDYKWTDTDTELNLEELIEAIEKLDLELSVNDDNVRKRRHLVYETLDFDNIEADEVQVQLLNGEQIYIKNSELIFPGTVNFENLNVLHEIKLSSNRYVRETSVELGENISLNTINNIQWIDFVNDLIFRSTSLNIDELQVLGEVISEGVIDIHNIGGIKFPDNFLLSSGSSQSTIVKAKKYFVENLVSNAVDTGGVINGLNPFGIITLSENEFIPGLTTFRNLDVSEKLIINGTVQSRGLSDFLSNPTFLESIIINSACSFYHLEIEGPIRVSDKLSGNNLDAVLNDIIFRSKVFGEEIFIQSKKYFKSPNFIDSSLRFKENFLSGLQLHTFVTKNTQQDLNIRHIIGNIYFNNLQVTGLYDSVDINELTKSSLLADEDYFGNGDIEFTKKVSVQSLTITESFNREKVFITLKDEVEFNEVSINTVQAQKILPQCDITGSGYFNGINLKQLKRSQSKTAFIDEMILINGLQAETLLGIDSKFLVSFLQKVDNIPVMIMEGKIHVEKLHVDGDIQVNKLESHNFDEDIPMTAIWLTRPSFLRTKLEFHDQIIVQQNLIVKGFLNELDFYNLTDDIVYKLDSHREINSVKDFFSNLIVFGDVDVTSVNVLDFADIATKQTVELFNGILEINGDLVVDNLAISGLINDFSVGNFTKKYRYDTDLKSIVLIAEVTFEGKTNIENLFILGNLNSIGNINEFFENIVYKNNICILKGKTTFKARTTIERGAYIKNINGHNIAQLMRNIVFINEPVPIVIFTPVTFKDIVQAADVTVKKSINTTNLMGCQLGNWLVDTLRKNEDVDFGGLVKFTSDALDKNSLYSVSLNGMDLDYIVSLHIFQNISSQVVFSDVYLSTSINTGGLVNGHNLQEEKDNSLIKIGNQHIKTPLTMQSCSIIYSLQTNVINNNGIDFKNLAFLHENLVFSSPLSFSKLITKNVLTGDLISGIDFVKWKQKSLHKSHHLESFVTGNWKINELSVKSHTINEDFPKSRFLQITYEIHDKYDKLYQWFDSLCQKCNKFIQKALRKVHFPKYIQKSFSLTESLIIEKVFLVADPNEDYILVNIDCSSIIFKWDLSSKNFKQICSFESGLLEDVVTFPAKNGNLHLVTNGQSGNRNCTHLSGVHLWSFEGNNVLHMKNYNDFNISAIHHSAKNENIFYVIDGNHKKVFQLTTNTEEKQFWSLPQSEDGSYRFLPSDAELGIALSNGQHILLLNPLTGQRFKRSHQSQIGRNRFKYEVTTPSKLVGNILSISHFRNVLVRSLREVIHKLNIQLAEVNYTLSESGLPDEHLENDFKAILEEIKNQNILPPESFVEYNFDQHEFSSNFVQILAAKVVQVIWPVLVEVEEVHSHLQTDEHDHTICSEIFSSLSSVVNEVLQIASKKNRINTNEVKNFENISNSIKNFQKRILLIIDNLQEESEELFDKPPASGEAPTNVYILNRTVENPLDEPFIGQAITGRNLLTADSPHLPARGAGEIVSVKTGMPGIYRTLIAVTDAKEHVIAGEMDSVKIFFDVITGSLFQSLSAYKPRCLISKRIQNENILAFVENKHTIRVFIYKGIQGFVEFVKFKANDEIRGMQFISLGPKETFKIPKTFIMATGRNKVDFYEILMIGTGWYGKEINCNF